MEGAAAFQSRLKKASGFPLLQDFFSPDGIAPCAPLTRPSGALRTSSAFPR
jgi:hypothetical protein